MNDTKLHKAPHRWPLVLIALDKLVKAVGLVIISFVLTPRWSESLTAWAINAQLGPHNWFIMDIFHAIEKGLGYPPHTLHLIRIFVVIYAALYLVEGVGLIFEQRLAEWVVVITTAASLPVEVFNFIRRPSWAMVILFLLNMLMAGYLAWRLHKQAVIMRELAEKKQAVVSR